MWKFIYIWWKETNEYKKQYSVQMKVYRQHNSSHYCVEEEEPSTQKIYLWHDNSMIKLEMRLISSWWRGEEWNRGNCCWERDIGNWRHAWKWRQAGLGDASRQCWHAWKWRQADLRNCRHCWHRREARKWRQIGVRQWRLSGWQGWQGGLWQRWYRRQWGQCWFRQIWQLQKITSCFPSQKRQRNEERQDTTLESCHAGNVPRPHKTIYYYI